MGAPSAIEPGQVGSAEITISWEPILPSQMNGQLLGYKVINYITMASCYYMLLDESLQEQNCCQWEGFRTIWFV